MKLELGFMKLHPNAIIPTKAHDGDLGWDLYALENTYLGWGKPGILIRTGIACSFPDGVGGIIKDRSSIATKKRVYTHAGVIDNGYRGEIKVWMENHSPYSQEFAKGDKIAQMILVPIIDVAAVELECLDETIRGAQGFGSSGL